MFNLSTFLILSKSNQMPCKIYHFMIRIFNIKKSFHSKSNYIYIFIDNSIQSYMSIYEPKSHLSSVWNVSLGGLLLEVHGDAVNLLVVKQVRHLTRVQDTVDVLKETLLQGGHGVTTHPDANMILNVFARRRHGNTLGQNDCGANLLGSTNTLLPLLTKLQYTYSRQ